MWLQIQMRDLASSAANSGTPLPPLIHRYYARWFAPGWPAFIGVMTALYLLVAKPTIWGCGFTSPMDGATQARVALPEIAEGESESRL